MPDFSKRFERYYQWTHENTRALLEHWRQHTNRRTILASVILGAAAIALYLTVIRPPSTFPVGELVTIQTGQNDSQIAQALYDDGVIRSPLAFRIIAKVIGRSRELHAGDYLFKEPKDIFTVAHAVAVGAYGLEPFKIRIPEGATMKDMAAIYSTVLQRFNKDTFLANVPTDEGYLFPDTYFFLPNATDQTVTQAMRDNFDTQTATIKGQIASSSHSKSDIVIMASILEREARNFQDRRMIAGVLWRRIAKGMALQADATFLYTLGKGSFDLTKADLASDSPYNTYTHKGLPPTPIGSPSLSSIEAAATPIDKGYLFYLADNHGVTHYAKTYAQHQANERMYLGK